MAAPGPGHGSRASQADEEPLQTTNVGVDPRHCPVTSLFHQPEKRNNNRLERPASDGGPPTGWEGAPRVRTEIGSSRAGAAPHPYPCDWGSRKFPWRLSSDPWRPGIRGSLHAA